MDKNYTLYSAEQIETAFNNLSIRKVSSTSEELIAELAESKIEWIPQEGEVYSYKSAGAVENCFTICNDSPLQPHIKRRPLTPDEVPALKVAVEWIKNYAVKYPGRERTLEKIKELTNETK